MNQGDGRRKMQESAAKWVTGESGSNSTSRRNLANLAEDGDGKNGSERLRWQRRGRGVCRGGVSDSRCPRCGGADPFLQTTVHISCCRRIQRKEKGTPVSHSNSLSHYSANKPISPPHPLPPRATPPEAPQAVGFWPSVTVIRSSLQ